MFWRSCLFLLLLSSVSISFAQIERGEPLPRRGAFGARLAAPEPNVVGLIEVLPGGTAQALGLKAGDVVRRINGQEIKAPAEIALALRSLTAGQAVTVTYTRDGQEGEARGALVARPMQRPDGFRVHYDQVVSQGRRIRVIATYPETPGPHPTVFLIGGIGAYSVDGDFAGVPYGNVMAPLAKMGYATVRVDKPGQGDSEGPVYAELRFGMEQDAYLQALRLAKTFDFVDKDRIAIFGHSMGGTFGPLVAGFEPVAGVAVYGTLVKTWTEYLLENTRRQSLLGGGSPAEVDAMLRDVAAVHHYLFYEDLTPEQVIEKHPKLAEVVRGTVPDLKTYSGVGIGFWQDLAKINLAEATAKMNTSLLAMWAENDFISTRADHEFMAEIANQTKPGSGEFVVVPQSDHGFTRTTSLLDSMQRWGRGGEFNPATVDILTRWLEKTIGKPRG